LSGFTTLTSGFNFIKQILTHSRLGIVTAAEVLTKDLGDTQKQLKSINKEIDDVWEGMDYLSNPLK
jgi:hypothetical protein